ncbi:MAG: hypothetical protein AABZ32_09605 [Bacteroidota bacterium]
MKLSKKSQIKIDYPYKNSMYLVSPSMCRLKNYVLHVEIILQEFVCDFFQPAKKYGGTYK